LELVGEKDAVQVVDLVLDDMGLRSPEGLAIRQRYLVVAPLADEGVGQTQAALGREVGFPRADDLRVHEGLVPVGDEKPGVDADLRGRQTIFSRS